MEEAYHIAIDLGLSECAAVCKPPATIGLLACLEAIPCGDVLSLDEAAKYLGYSVSGLCKIVKRKEIRFAQNGQGPIKFQREWLDDFLTCHKVERSQAQSRRAPISIQTEHGFDPKLLG